MKKKNVCRVAIVMGSKTDLKIMQNCTPILKDYGITFDLKILSAHRTPGDMSSFAKNAHEKYAVIIAGAGGAAHLPGMIASYTCLPVIGVPISVGKLKGLDSLLSIVQMPKGVPVATVAIDNAENAGHLAARILGLSLPLIQKKLWKHRDNQKRLVKNMRKELSVL